MASSFCSQELQCHATPTPRTVAPPRLQLYIINSLEEDKAAVCLHLSAQLKLSGPSFLHVCFLSFVLF
jgi:hypothetical protein